MIPWYTLHVRSNCERKVQEALQGKGFEEFTPWQLLRNRKKEAIERPLFPGYLFCRFGRDTRTAVLQIPGVIRVLGLNGEPIPVPEVEVENVRRVLEAGTLVEPVPLVKAGEYVRVQSGPLEGVEGYVIYVRDHARVLVSVTMLNRSVSAEVDPAWLVKAQLGKAA